MWEIRKGREWGREWKGREKKELTSDPSISLR